MFITKIAKALTKHKVPYAIVGGFAVALHGAVRGTVDVDFVISLSLKDYQNCEQAMLSLDLQPKLPITASDVFNFREEYIKNRNLIAWSFTNPSNPIELVDIIITQNLKDIKTVKKKINNTAVSVASIPDLIRMKKESNRQQDKEDVKALEKLL